MSKLHALAALGLVVGTVGSVSAEAPAACVMPTDDQVAVINAKLDPMHQALFKALDCESQNMAIQLINQSCKGKNSCKGLNSCKTATNDCKGKGSCKGQSPGPFMNKNDAVDVVAMKMMQKRLAASSSS